MSIPEPQQPAGTESPQGCPARHRIRSSAPFDTGSTSKAPAEIVEFVRLQLSTLAVPTPPAGHEAPPGD